MKKIWLFAVAGLALTSCSDFLEREPMDFGNQESYFRSDEDLKISANQFYTYLPKNSELWGGLYAEDVKSDNQCTAGAQSLFYKGDKQTVKVDASEWNFEHLREINFFLDECKAKYDGIKGYKNLIDHYIGEGYFFRAYEHYRLLRNFGDAPILQRMLTNNADELTAASKRYPRNEVARAILLDLDTAITKLQDVAPESGRVMKAAAQAFKSRVALYEATWEKYHAGTCFVPGNAKWPGRNAWPEFAFKAGSAEAEINFFLDQAIAAADAACQGRQLDEDYAKMFTRWADAFPDNDEVLLARYYKSGVIAHSCSNYLKGGGGCGVTRAAVNSFLMTSGLPIYADPQYKGDRTSYEEFQGRDTRLTKSVRAAGSFIETKMEDGHYVNDTIFYYRPYIYISGNEKATTGYELDKWVVKDNAEQATQYMGTSAVPLLRAGEAMCNYLEAYVERYGHLGGNCDTYWKALRRRAGVSEDYQKTIDNTDLSKENDLGVWSRSQQVSKLLYNVRRERRCELIAEGLRLDDLKRWRALDMMKDYQPEGFNLWDEMYKMYDKNQIDANSISQSSISKYIHPLQVKSTAKAYEGYNFPKQHYTEPIPISQFLLTGGLDNSTIYQNPGWPSHLDGTADYGYDCD